MADGDDPTRPRPPLPPPGKPIPRLWKAEEESEAEQPPRDRRARIAAEKAEKEAQTEATKPSGKAKTKPDAVARKSSKDAPKPKRKGVLLEDTPELDTYESRQRVRLLMGGAIAAAVLVAGIVLYNSLQGPAFDETDLVDEGGPSPGGPPPAVASAPAGPSKAEQEAMNLLGTARQFAKNDKRDQAKTVLERVMKSYPKTRAATLAKAATARMSQDLPPFEEIVVATGVAKPKPVGRQVVDAVDVNPPSDLPGQSGNAAIELNPNPSEAPRAPSGVSAAKTTVVAKPLPAGFKIEEESGIHKSGWPYQIVSDRDGGVMVLVPAGTYTQGRDDGVPDEGPSHKVRLNAFYIDQHEITNRQFNFYLKETGHQRSTRVASSTKLIDEEPVTNVTAFEAIEYGKWSGKRLPSEAQWEAAARSTDGRPHPWGSSEPVWNRPRLPRQIDPVGAYPLDQSPSGVLDLAGNAWEWTNDWFDPKYYQQLQGQVSDEPVGPPTSRAKPPEVVIKGGSKLWVAAWREGMKPETKLPYLGFRTVLSVESGGPTAPAGSPAGATAPTNSTPASKSSRPPANANGVVPF